MKDRRVDYDQLAANYNRRFKGDHVSGVARALEDLVDSFTPASVVEIGCGTGHWMENLKGKVPTAYALDLSMGMLQQAKERSRREFELIQGDAIELPFNEAEFDLVYCVNAIHHFGRPEQFVDEAHRILRDQGLLAVFGSDPHGKPDRWFGYHYFPSTYPTDLKRFPGEKALSNFFTEAGFTDFRSQQVDQVKKLQIGRDVLADPFLKKESLSQLALLDESEYLAGLERIKSDIDRAEKLGERIEFKTDIKVLMWSGQKS